MNRTVSVIWMSLALVAGCDRTSPTEGPHSGRHEAPIDRAPAEPTPGAPTEAEPGACARACAIAAGAECPQGPVDDVACVAACELDRAACGVGGDTSYASYLECVEKRGLTCHATRGTPVSQECVMEAFRGVGVVCAQSGDVGTRKPHCGTACALAVDAECQNGPRDLQACIEECTAERRACSISTYYDAYFTCILEEGFVCDAASGAPVAERCRRAAFEDGTCSGRSAFGVP